MSTDEDFAKPGQRYTACNVCRIRKIGCDGDGINPCGPCQRFNANKPLKNTSFKFVDKSGKVECKYHQTRFDVPKYMSTTKREKKTLKIQNEKDTEEAIINGIGKGKKREMGHVEEEDEAKVQELEQKLGHLQGVLEELTLQGSSTSESSSSSGSPPSSNTSASVNDNHAQPYGIYFLPAPSFARSLIAHAFQRTFLLPQIISIQDVLPKVDAKAQLTLSEAILLHAIFLIGSFNIPWDNVQQQAAASNTPDNRYWRLPPLSTLNDIPEGEGAEEQMMTINSCHMMLYMTFIDSSPPEANEISRKQCIFQHHLGFVNRHVYSDMDYIIAEEGDLGVEQVIKACLLLAWYGGQMQGSIGTKWRKKMLELCVESGWHKGNFGTGSAFRRYQNSLSFWTVFLWDHHLSIVRDEPFVIPFNEVQTPLPTLTFVNPTLEPRHSRFFTDKNPLWNLDPLQIMLKCSILPIKVAALWKEFDKGPPGGIPRDISKMEIEQEFKDLATTVDTFQACFPVTTLHQLCSKDLQSINPNEIHERDCLFNAHLALSLSFLTLHSKFITPNTTANPPFIATLSASQTCIQFLPIFKNFVETRQFYSNHFVGTFGIAMKSLFRSLVILQNIGKTREAKELEILFSKNLEISRDISKIWKGIVPTLIPVIKLTDDPRLCLEPSFDLTKIGLV